MVAASEEQFGPWADGVITADRLGVSEHFQVLSADELRERIASPVFRGALYRTVGATVHPGAWRAGCGGSCSSAASGSSRTRR